MKISILERLDYLARGNRPQYLHKNGKENKQTTKLQNFIDENSSLKGGNQS